MSSLWSAPTCLAAQTSTPDSPLSTATRTEYHSLANNATPREHIREA
jgi:hypothetical protein